MNPFLHDTVAQPLPVPAQPVSVQSIPARHALPRHQRRRLARVLRVAGLTALAWTGSVAALNLNTATLDELQGIRGIGPKTARIILDERTRGGPYVSFADLSDRVRGIGPRRAQALQSAGLTVDGGGTRLSGQGMQARQAAQAGAGSVPARRSP